LEPGNFLINAKSAKVDPLHIEINRLKPLNSELKSENEKFKKRNEVDEYLLVKYILKYDERFE